MPADATLPDSAPVATEPMAQPLPAAAAQAPAASAAPTVAQEAIPTGLPKVTAYTLPVQDLEQVAANAGLQWVNSDAEKVALVRAAIAAEPRPVHVPRERPPAVVIDEGPLVLVETRKDLADLKLPF